MARQEVDIAIIGAGVVGLATALTIAPTGLRIAVFDAQKEPNEPSEERALNAWSRRVTALTPASNQIFKGTGGLAEHPRDAARRRLY
jgi:2-polyprenyl-6-methoxyphenol hydroxylase-like FAD-dependent oxidoreductase